VSDLRARVQEISAEYWAVRGAAYRPQSERVATVQVFIALARAEQAAMPTAELREALRDLLDDYLARYGPDGFPQPMPGSWRVVQTYLGRT